MKMSKCNLCVALIGCLLLACPAVAQNFFNQSDVQWLAVPDHDDWIYETGEKAQIDVQILLYGKPQDGVVIDYALSNDCLEKDRSGQVTTRNGHAVIPVGTMKKPGFRDCVMTCEVNGKRYKNHLKLGFSPEDIKPYTTCPSDFDQYWKDVLADQQAVPLQVEVTPAPAFADASVDCHLVKIRCYRKQSEHYIYGYLTKPKKPGKYPVVISPPGAGVKPMDPMKTIFYAKNGWIRLDLEIHGIAPDVDAQTYKDISRAFGGHMGNGYLANGIANRDTYYMRKVYASLVKAVDYVTTLPEWDGKNIMLQGNSQGAALSIVLAALDPRVDAIAVAHPALTDMAGYAEKDRTGGYPHFGRKYLDVSLTKDVIATLSYYDVINFARRVKCPVFMTWGYNDNTCPPTTSQAVYNILDCPKESLITPINEHWISTATRYVQMDFLRQYVQ